MVEQSDDLALLDFEWFCDVVMGYRPMACHVEWITALRKHKRLLITAPPEHAKTTYIAVLYPAWVIARNPDARIVIVCSTEAAAEERARAVQTILRDERYQRCFPWVVPAEPWTTTRFTVRRRKAEDPFPTVMACGVTSNSLIGQRADLIIMDDPMHEESARSELQRRLLDIWIRRTLITRLTDDAESRMVCIMTRWHEADAANTLLDMGFEHVHHIATPEKPLWPERFGSDYLRQRRAEMGTVLYNCMYLGDPSGLEGRLFKRDWFEVVDTLPELRQVVTGWDLAASTKTEADYTCKVTLARGVDGNIYVLDVWRRRAEWPEVRRQVAFHATRERPWVVGIEPTAFQLAAVQQLKQDGLDVPIREVPADKDKISRALEWVSNAEAMKVKLVRGSWNDDWLSEVSAFPDGKHDDQVDAFSIAYRLLVRHTGEADIVYTPRVTRGYELVAPRQGGWE